MSASRTIPSRSPTITPHIETVCANNTRICPTNSDKRASSPLYPGSMASNSISVSVNLNAAPDTAESNYLPLQNLCPGGAAGRWNQTLKESRLYMAWKLWRLFFGELESEVELFCSVPRGRLQSSFCSLGQ